MKMMSPKVIEMRRAIIDKMTDEGWASYANEEENDYEEIWRKWMKW